SLAKEGWPRHQVNGRVPLKGTARSVSPIGRNIKNGWFVQLPIIGGWNEPPRLRPLKRLRRFFLMGAATPPLPRRGVPFGCFATFIEKSAHPEFLEVRRSELRECAAQIERRTWPSIAHPTYDSLICFHPSVAEASCPRMAASSGPAS